MIAKSDIHNFVQKEIDDIIKYQGVIYSDNIIDYLDSLDVMSIIMEAESKYGVTIDESKLPMGSLSIDQLVDIIYEKIQK